MAQLQNNIVAFRPHVDVRPDFVAILKWCEENDSSYNSVLNSFIPAIAYAIQNQVIQTKGKRYIRADFGDVYLRELNERRKPAPPLDP